MPGGYSFDEQLADRAVAFFPRFLRHYKGRLAGRPFELSEFQRDITRTTFGTIRTSDGIRRYRTLYVEMPKKNGKSTWAGGKALFLTGADGEPGAEVYGAAVDREQARIVFDSAANMIDSSPRAQRYYHVIPGKGRIVCPRSRSYYQVLSSVPASKHGPDAHGLVIDELHAFRKRALVDALEYSGAARRQPLTVILTTAGTDKNTIGWEKHRYAQKVLANPSLDPTFLPIIFAAPNDADWHDPKVWAAANPGLGTILRRDALEAAHREAAQTPAKASLFRQLHLNQWMQPTELAIDMTKWQLGAARIHLEALDGARCWGGLDLASRRDLAAFALVFPLDDGRYVVLVWAWIPEANLAQRIETDQVPYDQFIERGYVEPTPGGSISYPIIRQRVQELGKRYRIEEIAFDRWDATYLRQELESDGFILVQFGQGWYSMNAPSKEFDVLAHDGRLIHGGNPLLEWCAGNLVWQKDPAGNYKPSKRHSTEKIDPVVAVIMGLGRAMARPARGSRYDSAGVRSVGE